ncbi:DUF3999 family protein [Edaphobacter aggregans]|uniref:DUF3999 family protein n=1 Tax=Edaphobacter aggregans TaxID=570835 RepID=UPI0005591976|nr:DUF3999 family protein [Edaphobacter aggregans]
MKLLLPLLALMFWQAGARDVSVETAERQYFRYQRSVVPTETGQNCAVLDAAVFAHGSAALKDVRLFPQTAVAREIPYAITLSEPAQPDAEPARVLNLGLRGRTITFDLAMPQRPYTEVVLDLAGRDFIAAATVMGEKAPGSDGTRLGEFTLFDLTTQHLSRSTTLPLEESSFPYLHVELNVSPAPGTAGPKISPQMVRGVSVPPSREAQTLFALAAETKTITQRGRQTVARFTLPERVPVERITFVLAPEFKGNFSRDVVITDHAQGTPASAGETIYGTILRVRLNQAGREIRQQQLSVPATLGSNLQSAAEVEVAVNNGDDQPLPITAVRLEMRERRLCFDARALAPVTLFYGDAALAAPLYDYARTFSAAGAVHTAQMGPEQQNPVYTLRPDMRALTERHPELVWVIFLAVICVLAVIAIRSTRHLSR